MSIRQFAPKQLPGDVPDVGYNENQPSLDQIIEARVAGYVGAIVQPLRAEIAELRSQMEQVDEDGWPMLFSPKRACAYLDISRTTLNTLVDRGLIEPTVPYGMEQRYYTREALDAWRTASK